MKRRFVGVGTALITPFNLEGEIDWAALKRLVDLQIAGGVDFLAPCGTTGESSTQTMDEHKRLIQFTVETAAGRVPVHAGTGSNNTNEAIHLTREAEKAGVNGSLQVAPYYNRPTQEGLYRHFKAIAEACPRLSMVLYNIPSRCGVEIGVDTVSRLVMDCENIVGIKEAGGNVDRVSQLRAALGSRFIILCGDDSLTLPFMSVGAQGVISVASNIAPRKVSQMVRACSAGNMEKALSLHEELYWLFKALFVETNPGPVKAALSLMYPDVFWPVLRLPLAPMSTDHLEELKSALFDLGFLQERKRSRDGQV